MGTGEGQFRFAIFGSHNISRIWPTTLRVMPAMEAGLTHHVWEPDELVALID
jgi:hypothetical protein